MAAPAWRNQNRNSGKDERPPRNQLPKSPSSEFPPLPGHSSGSKLPFEHAEVPIQHPKDVLSYRDAAAHIPEAEPELRCEPSEQLEESNKYLDFPFLNDELTIKHLKQKGTKLMIVLRGLPGSGKSAICGELLKMFENVGVASADKFWMENGVYKFDQDRLQEAHEWCKEQCEILCKNDVQIVIIDNTNITYREMVSYFRKAHRYGYPTVIIEPQTPWRYDPKILHSRNVHNVALDRIESRLKQLVKGFVFPIYYGFMVSAEHSLQLMRFAVKLSNVMFQIDEIKSFTERPAGQLLAEFARTTSQQLQHWKERDDLLHCTAFYTNHGKRAGAVEYGERKDVQQSLGKMHLLEITGFIVTPRTMSYRLTLEKQQLQLWKPEDDGQPELPPGSRAHLTLSTAKGVASVTAGLDILQLGHCLSRKEPKIIDCPAGLILNFPEEELWYLDLAQPLRTPSLFSQFFTWDSRQNVESTTTERTTDEPPTEPGSFTEE